MKPYQTIEIEIIDFTTEDVCTISTTPDYLYDIFHSEEGGVLWKWQKVLRKYLSAPFL